MGSIKDVLPFDEFLPSLTGRTSTPGPTALQQLTNPLDDISPDKYIAELIEAGVFNKSQSDDLTVGLERAAQFYLAGEDIMRKRKNSKQFQKELLKAGLVSVPMLDTPGRGPEIKFNVRAFIRVMAIVWEYFGGKVTLANIPEQIRSIDIGEGDRSSEVVADAQEGSTEFTRFAEGWLEYFSPDAIISNRVFRKALGRK